MTTKHEKTTKTNLDNEIGGGGFQVVLYNDNHNTFAFVVVALMKTFGHSQVIAFKVAQEAHNKGRAVAEVEDERSAMKHCLALRLCGLGSDVEKVEL